MEWPISWEDVKKELEELKNGGSDTVWIDLHALGYDADYENGKILSKGFDPDTMMIPLDPETCRTYSDAVLSGKRVILAYGQPSKAMIVYTVTHMYWLADGVAAFIAPVHGDTAMMVLEGGSAMFVYASEMSSE